MDTGCRRDTNNERKHIFYTTNNSLVAFNQTLNPLN